MLNASTDTLRPPGVDPISARCAHCGNPLAGSSADAFCCGGCRTVHDLIGDAGLSRYYELRDAVITPPAAGSPVRRDRNWLEPVCARLSQAERPIELAIKLQGLRCAACVWLIQELFARLPGAHRVLVNSGRGSASLCVDARFPLEQFVSELESFGYLAGEDAAAEGDDSDLLLRTGVCLALGGNAMMFAAAIYLGLHEGPLYRVLHGLNFACATLAVLIGAPVFMRSAWQALRRGILHLDLPIALGIALSYGGALWSFLGGHSAAAYYDSLATFIGLMLLGRWLKERIVLANRQQLLANDGVDRILVRRIEAGVVRLRPAGELRAGDELLIPPGDLVPVAAELLERSAAISLDWISGESEPQSFAEGSVLPAGAFNAESCALRVRSRDDFGSSVLVDLLGRQQARELPATKRGNAFSIAYVAGVLLTAATSFVGWWLLSGSATRALEIATAICVVTCPCAIGIGAPLAEDLVLAGLRRAGLFVRSASFLDRALAVRHVVFDKTGTLTTGQLHVANPATLRALSRVERDLLYTFASASAHPKSAAVARALSELDARLLEGVRPVEVTGEGVECVTAERRYRLGRAAWSLTEAWEPPRSAGDRWSSDGSRPPNASRPDADLVFAREGHSLCALHTAETPRPDATREVAALRRDGYRLSILSGDAPARVQKMALELGVEPTAAHGGCTPSAKAAWITEHDRADVLMIGDGVNDSLAVQSAFASGTPAIDRAFMPWRSDFYFVSAGLGPIRLALRAARRLSRVVRGNQVFAVLYNVAVVALAASGCMRPWLAAVLMPTSSLVVLSATSISLSARSRLWKS